MVPAVQLALKTGWRPSLKFLCLTVMTGRASRTAFAVLSEDEDEVQVVPENSSKRTSGSPGNQAETIGCEKGAESKEK